MYRKAEPDDCEGIYRLICELECEKLPFVRFSGIYLEQVKDRNYYCLVCEQGGEVTGVLNLRFEEQLHHSARIAEIMEFAVDAACRGRGIGREMFEIACRIAREHGCVQIEAACNQTRTDAHQFYTRAGMYNSHYKFYRTLPEENTAGSTI